MTHLASAHAGDDDEPDHIPIRLCARRRDGTLSRVWGATALGIIGTEGDRADLMFLGVLAIGTVGAIVTRLQPRGTTRVMLTQRQQP